MNEIKMPKNEHLFFGGKITKDEERILECSIYEKSKGYAGKISYIYSIIS